MAMVWATVSQKAISLVLASISVKNDPNSQSRHIQLGILAVALIAGAIAVWNGLLRLMHPAAPEETPPLTIDMDAPQVTQETRQWVWGVFFLIFVVSGVLLVFLPRTVGVFLFRGLIVLALGGGIYASRHAIAHHTRRFRAWIHVYQAKTITPTRMTFRRIPLWLVLAEIAIIVFVSLYATRLFWIPDAQTQLAGREAQWLTGSAYVVTDTLTTHGYFPLWHPYNEKGEPLIDNPFAFSLNPFSMAPTLIMGDATQGIKTSVAVYAVLAALGGWFLAYVLGMGSIGRLLLAVLLLGKGNMVAMITGGYYQLGVSQAYMPWILGAMFVMVRDKVRWAGVLLAVALTLQLWAGNIWYTLPMLISIGAIWLFWDYRAYATTRAGMFKRLMLVALITIGLSAAVLFPIFAKRAYIGGHKPLVDGGETINMRLVLQQFVTPDHDDFRRGVAPAGFEPWFHYSYTTTGWFLGLLFVIVPPIAPITGRGRIAGTRRFYVIGIVLILVFLLWGIGGLQPFKWLYNTLPGISRWRFVGRALGVASFWLAILVALRADGLWIAITNADQQPYYLPRRLMIPFATIFLLIAGLAGWQSVRIWDISKGVTDLAHGFDECAAWLRDNYPDEPLTIYRQGYSDIGVFYRQGIRVFPIEADYFAEPVGHGIGIANLLTYAYPEFAIPAGDEDYTYALTEQGYIPLDTSPKNYRADRPCAMRFEQALPYAFSAPLSLMQETRIERGGSATSLTLLEKLPDRITVEASPLSDRQLVVAVQESAYPGWQAYLNGERTRLEPVGGYVGIVLQPGDPSETATVMFAYRPGWFYIGAWTTLASALLCSLWLSGFDRYIVSEEKYPVISKKDR